jgi:hypothetical protein
VPRTGATASLVELREAVRRKAIGSSLRQTATNIGMSWSGLRTFLNGTTPHPATVKKISDWYLRQSTDSREDDALAVEMALNVLAERVAPSQRRALKRALLDTVAEFTERTPTVKMSQSLTAPKRKST